MTKIMVLKCLEGIAAFQMMVNKKELVITWPIVLITKMDWYNLSATILLSLWHHILNICQNIMCCRRVTCVAVCRVIVSCDYRRVKPN